MKTTLNKIREHSPCESGWRKLLAHLGKTKSDDEPFKKPWVGLTDEQIKIIEAMALTKNMAIAMTMATLKEKNT